MGSLLIFLVIVVALVAWLAGIYNALVTARNGYRNAFAQIDVQLQRRFDLIPNLVSTVKGYASHESGVFQAVTEARARVSKAAEGTDVAEKSQAEAALSQALVNVMAVAEAYPELKANQTMMQLTEELTSTENKVAFARQAFNDAVMAYNNRREVFPNSVFAGMFGFQPATLLEIAADRQAQVREAPKVQF
ncbi:MAG: LemA family protein [Thermomonas sp.]